MPAPMNAMRTPRLLALAALGAFAVWQQAPFAGGADSSGYLNAAKLFAQGRVSITGEAWWYLRFILPAFPALVVGGTLVWIVIVNRVTAPWPPALRATVLPVALAGLVLHAVSWIWKWHPERVEP